MIIELGGKKLDKKNMIIMTMGYLGILIIVLGFIFSPSPGDLKDAENRMNYYFSNDYFGFDRNLDEYNEAWSDYDRLKRQEVVSSHLVPIGLALVALTIPFAILRFTGQGFKAPPSPPPFPMPEQRVRKPEDFLINSETGYQERTWIKIIWWVDMNGIYVWRDMKYE